jgi:glycerol-3-phosphate dehydrogenase
VVVDVVIVGAGVHGAGVAQAAAAGGFRTLLLEKHHPAHGTSSRSSKLIHGGLRYLETAQFRLVEESLAERALMLQNAPDLVQLRPFHVPVYRDTRRRPWQLRAGLALYALLGRFRAGTEFGTVPRSQWSRLDGLDLHGLQSVFRYFDGQTDDVALTRAVVQSAISLGCELAAPAAFTSARLTETGVVVQYSDQSGTREVEARVLINAAGPWVADVISHVSPLVLPRAVELVQGTHILLPGDIREGIYYVEAPQDRRAVFVMPWRGQTLVGTTETPYEGPPEKVRPLTTEVDYLLQVAQRYFERYRALTSAPVIDSFAGLRVLPAGRKRAFDRPRETMFDVDRADRPRMLTIYGGKLTGWRATAEQVIERVKVSLPDRSAVADTKSLKLVPAE